MTALHRLATRLAVTATLVVVVTAASACGPSGSKSSGATTPSISPSSSSSSTASTPTPAVTNKTPNVSPGPADASVMAVMTAFSSGDAAAIQRVFDWFPLACGAAGATAFPCPEGVSNATVLSVVAALVTCSGSGGAYMLQRTPANLADRILNDRLALAGGYRTVAVADANDQLDLARFAPGILRYLILESRSSPNRGLIVGVSVEGVRLLATDCGSSAAQMIQSRPWRSLKNLDTK